jgi:hypothetical protein
MAQTPQMRVVHEWGKWISIEADGVERLRYHYQLPDDPHPSAPKPFIHPLRNAEGDVLTALEPLDHFWHRGLWFAWKYLNGVNYWEENQEIVGRQVTRVPPFIGIDHPEQKHNTVQISTNLDWQDTQNGETRTRLRELRKLYIRFETNGAMVLDWTGRQIAEEDLTLDRTVYTTWGGYGGLYVRLSQAVQKQQLVCEGLEPSAQVIGEPARWGAIEATLDNGPGKRDVSVIFLPATINPRYPEPFYGDAKPFYNFFGPAPLFHEPFTIAARRSLFYAVRVLVLPRRVQADEVERYRLEWENSGANQIHPAWIPNQTESASPA